MIQFSFSLSLTLILNRTKSKTMMKIIQVVSFVYKIFFLSYIDIEKGRFKVSNFWITVNTVKLSILSIFHLMFNNMTFEKGNSRFKMVQRSLGFVEYLIAFELLCLWLDWAFIVIKRKSLLKAFNLAYSLALKLSKLGDFSKTYAKLRFRCLGTFLVFNLYQLVFLFYAVVLSKGGLGGLGISLIRIQIYNFMVLFCFTSQFAFACIKHLKEILLKSFSNHSAVILTDMTTKFEKDKSFNELSSLIDFLNGCYQNLFELVYQLSSSFNMIAMVSLLLQFLTTVAEVKL